MKTAYLGPGKPWKTYGKAIRLSIAKIPPRIHGQKRRLPSSEAGHVGLPACKIENSTYSCFRSSSDAGNLILSLCRCHGIWWRPSFVMSDYHNVLTLPYWLKEVSLDKVWLCRQPMQSWQTHGFPTSPEIFAMISCLAAFIRIPPKEN